MGVGLVLASAADEAFIERAKVVFFQPLFVLGIIMENKILLFVLAVLVIGSAVFFWGNYYIRRRFKLTLFF